MKKQFKIFMGFLAIIAVICMILLIPPVSNWVGAKVGIAGQKIRDIAATVAGAVVGVMLISFGVTALAAAPIVGAALIITGLAMLAYSLYPLFTKTAPSTPGLNKIQ